MSKLTVSASPHLTSNTSTATVMLDVIIALMPAFLASAIFFGLSSIILTLTCVVSCVGSEYVIRRIMKRSNTISDLSACVTGILLAFNLPSTLPLWMAVLGSVFAIVIVKQLFGGIGQNFANPAIVARIFLFISFSKGMNTFIMPYTVDTLSIATPLVDINAANTFNLFIGNVPGSLGEVSALALIVGGIYLVIRKVINPFVPLTFIATVFILTYILGENPLNHILAGGLMLGAIFMATDYATTPLTLKGKLIFALGCGIITALIRIFGSYPEGVSFAILFMNLITPLIDRFTASKTDWAKKSII